jgi:hypothetical protein
VSALGSSIRSWAANLLLVLGGLAFGLLLAEMVTWLVAPQPLGAKTRHPAARRRGVAEGKLSGVVRGF